MRNTTRRRTLQLGASGVLIGVLPALALQARAADMPAELAANLPGARTLGSGRLRFFGLDIYEARLWVGNSFQPASYADAPFALELIYFRSLKGKLIAERSLKEMQRQGSFGAEREQAWLATMEQAFPDVKNGDRITGLHTPGVGARFWHNGELRPLPASGAGSAGAEFSRVFFGIWLSDATSEPQLRNSLLGRAP